jgi:hypothetical protein
MKIIRSTSGMDYLVDDEDFPLLARFTWYENHEGYARTSINDSFVFMHRLVLGTAPSNRFADHINGNRRDNRRGNLRWASKTQNGINTRMRKDNTTGYRGVRLTKEGRYCAYTYHQKKQIRFGTFNTAEEAARARDAGMETLHGPEFLQKNFP